MKKIKKILMSFSMLTCFLLQGTSAFGIYYTSSNPNKNSSYNRNNAVSYAKNWVTKANPSYANYINDGGDCTNFVSQCLKAGGMSFLGSTSKAYNDSSWFYYGSNYPNRSSSWTDANYFRKHWGNTSSTNASDNYNRSYAYKEYTVDVALRNWETIYNNLWPGDVVQYGPSSGGTTHSQIVIDYTSSSKTTTMAQHSDSWSNFKKVSLKSYLNGRSKSDRVYLHLIKKGA